MAISSVATISPKSHKKQIIHDFEWSGFNATICHIYPPEVMIFGLIPPYILSKVLGIYPELGPVFMCKVELSSAFMRLWVQYKYILYLDFVLPLTPGDLEPLLGFHLKIPIKYLERVPLFFSQLRPWWNSKTPYDRPVMPPTSTPL